VTDLAAKVKLELCICKGQVAHGKTTFVVLYKIGYVVILSVAIQREAL
jgi:hypothetical protein